ncbi:MAG: type III-A CRISPR-associated protein Cas10/Csm1 [bacterium]
MKDNNQEYQTVILAALLHDIGKFIQRQSNIIAISQSHTKFSKDFFSEEEDFHALWLRDDIDLELIEKIVWNHHNAIIEETRRKGDFKNKREEALCQLVSDADTFSAGERHSETLKDKQESEEKRVYFTKRPLDPIFSQVELFCNPSSSVSPYKIGKLEPKGAFPDGPKQIQEGEILEHYKNHFIPELKEITADNFDGFYNSLLSLLEKYTWCLPSDTTKDIADISLYDHLKTTSAIAACLYRFHEQDIESYLDSSKAQYKFRLIGGDLSGIQDYIFKITEKGRGGVAKRLRSRSFYLSVLLEVTIQKILHHLKLPYSCNLISAGGRFVLLAPENISDKMMKDLQKEISTWLFEKFFGQITINLNWEVIITGYSLKIGKFHRYLNRVYENLELKKQRKNSEILFDGKWLERKFVRESQYERYSQKEGGAKDCQICHCFPASKKDNDGPEICSQCALDKKIGEMLPKTEYIALGKARPDEFQRNEADLIFFNNGKEGEEVYFLKLIKQHCTQLPQVNDHYYLLYRLYDVLEKKIEPTDLGIMNKFFANYVPLYKDLDEEEKELIDEDQETKPGSILTFGTLANLSQRKNRDGDWQGERRIGLLKADVDRLGVIFNLGLGKDVTVSRYLTMSRMIDLFFAGWVERTISTEFRELYTVFSGGDDLFLVGPWEEIIKFSQRLYKEFRSFTCQNDNITLSAGIAVLKPKLPIARGAILVNELLKDAKASNGRFLIGEVSEDEGRDQLTLFGTTLKWNEMEETLPFKDLLIDELKRKDSPFKVAFLHRLLKYHRMYLNVQKGVVEDLLYRSHLAYDIGRNIKRKEKDSKKVQEELMKWLEPLYSNDDGVKNKLMKNMKVPVFWAIYKNRR